MCLLLLTPGKSDDIDRSITEDVVRRLDVEVIHTLLLLRKCGTSNPLSGIPRDAIVYCLWTAIRECYPG